MRILFIGCVEFSHRALEKVISVGGNVVGVCTLKESAFNADFCDLSNLSKENAIPYYYVDDINSKDSIKWINQYNPDVIFCFGWSRLLKEEILSIAPFGVVGFHPTALPANRGRHPIIWALVLGLKKTASTFFFMDKGADSGDILSQTPITISDLDDARTLYDKVIMTALRQIEEFIPQLISNNYQRIKQDHNHTNTWRKRGKADGLIDWRMDANTIHNTVRALAKPYICADFQHNKIEYKLLKTELVFGDFDNFEPGKIINIVDDHFPIIKCGNHAIKLIDTEPKLIISKGAYI
jgi:methionyl-tRNA formyltransferase